MQTTKGSREGNGQASNYISISVGYFCCGLYLLQITNSEIYAYKAGKESVQKGHDKTRRACRIPVFLYSILPTWIRSTHAEGSTLRDCF